MKYMPLSNIQICVGIIESLAAKKSVPSNNESCSKSWDNSRLSQKMRLIVERVYVDGEDVVAMTLRSNCHLVLGHNANGPTDFTVDPFLYTCGSDRGQLAMWNTNRLREDLQAGFLQLPMWMRQVANTDTVIQLSLARDVVDGPLMA